MGLTREVAPSGRPGDAISLECDIRRPPEAVRRWWLEFPDDYRASDPDEQPYRIRILKRTPAAIEVWTYWRTPLAMPMKLRETLGTANLEGWTADMDILGLHVHDEFHMAGTAEGTRLTIHSSVKPRSPLGRMIRPVAAHRLLRMMKRVWEDAARICERDAR